MHVLRPLYVVLGIVALILLIRIVVVPKDFGVHENGYLYGWFRKSNEAYWKDLPVKYQGRDYCQDCHGDQTKQVRASLHAAIECENCHGPALSHPSEPAKLTVDRSRDLCLRCHSYLPYSGSKRSEIKGIDPARHNPDLECSGCHDPHLASKPK